MGNIETVASIKNHDEIIEMIDDIKKYENISCETFFEEKKPESIIEIQTSEGEYSNNKKKKNLFSNLFVKSQKNEIKEIKNLNPTVFKIRVNESGDLINTELKKKSVQKKNRKSLKSLFKKAEKDKKNRVEKTDKKEKTSKLKKGLSRLNKLKKAIPNKDKNEESKDDSKIGD